MIGVLVFPDFQLLDAAGPISVFEIASRLAGRPASIRVLAEAPGGGALVVRRGTAGARLAVGRSAFDPDRRGRRGGYRGIAIDKAARLCARR